MSAPLKDPICDLYEARHRGGVIADDIATFADSAYLHDDGYVDGVPPHHSMSYLSPHREAREKSASLPSGGGSVAATDGFPAEKDDAVSSSSKRDQLSSRAPSVVMSDDASKSAMMYDTFLYVASGALLILVLEQFVQIGKILGSSDF
jgi:hypothetical protein